MENLERLADEPDVIGVEVYSVKPSSAGPDGRWRGVITVANEPGDTTMHYQDTFRVSGQSPADVILAGFAGLEVVRRRRALAKEAVPCRS